MNLVIQEKAPASYLPYLIFIISLLITASIAAFVWAENYSNLIDIDTDADGLTDYEETNIYFTDWNNPDTDNDGYNDGLEVKNGYSPKQPKLKMDKVDSDNDGLNDEWEIRLGSNLTVKDTDNDGYLDGVEVMNNFSPTSSKADKIKKRIEVSTKNLRLSFYFGDILLDNYPVSTGKPLTPTPLGNFSIIAKYPIKNYNIYPNTKWNLHFATVNGLRYYIHGAYWHNNFGIATVSGGCVNLRYEDVENLYNFTPIGTQVIVQ
ncbi:MAG: L,D-transpeptidase [Candidatus Parcubacteria bacterium]|nr:L,D-transpeptidase [Candidatus Parcubacteria bacterium]